MGKKSIGGKRPGAGRPKEVKKERFPVTQEEKEMILNWRQKGKQAINKKSINIETTSDNKPIVKKSLKQLLNEIK